MKGSHCIYRWLIPVALVCLPAILLAQSNEGSPAASSSGSAMHSGTNSGKEPNASNVTAPDKKFVREAAEGGLAEVELGKLAAEKAANEEVKKFGQRMVDDHSKANEELKSIAGNKGIELPDQLSAKDKILKERLSKLSGESFDKAYMENMVKDHKKDVADFAQESSNGKDSEVKEFAKKTLPTLKDHLREAEKIAPSMKTSSTAQASH